jgi:hypothetical protein
MESVEPSGTRRIVLVFITVTIAFFAVVAAVWFAFDKAAVTKMQQNEDGYVEYEEKTKDELLVDIQQRETVELTAEEVDEKQAILDSIRRE